MCHCCVYTLFHIPQVAKGLLLCEFGALFAVQYFANILSYRLEEINPQSRSSNFQKAVKIIKAQKRNVPTVM